MAVTKTVAIDENEVMKRLVQKIAAYWNGKPITVSGDINSSWSDWRNSAEGVRKRVPGSKKQISDITGTIRATAVGTTLTIEAVYNVTIVNAPDDWQTDTTEGGNNQAQSPDELT